MLTKILLHRTDSKKAAAAADSGSEDGVSEADEPAPTSDIEMPDVKDESEGEGEESAPKKKEKAKASLAKKGKKKKGKGGIMFPEEWPWEQAKKIFEKPDVLPADEIEVELSLFGLEIQ
jgi:flap endonuclease-1